MTRWWSWTDVLSLGIASVATAANAWAFVDEVDRIMTGSAFWIAMSTLHFFLVFWMTSLALRVIRRLRDNHLALRMGVVVVRDGVPLPTRLYRVGERDGLQVWVVVHPLVEPGDEIHAAMLPPRTTVVGMGLHGPP